MSQHIPAFIIAAVALVMLPFLVAALLDYRKKSRLIKQQNFYYLGKPKPSRKRLDHWLVGFIYRRRWSRMRSLVPKMRTARVSVIQKHTSV